MAGSSWVKLDSDYPDNPKIHPLSHAAFRLHITLITYCAKELTDGHVSTVGYRVCTARAALGRRLVTKAVTELVTAGLLEPCTDGYMLHDFLAMNPQLERHVVEARRKKWRTKKHTDDNQFPRGNPHETPRA